MKAGQTGVEYAWLSVGCQRLSGDCRMACLLGGNVASQMEWMTAEKSVIVVCAQDPHHALQHGALCGLAPGSRSRGCHHKAAQTSPCDCVSVARRVDANRPNESTVRVCPSTSCSHHRKTAQAAGVTVQSGTPAPGGHGR